MITAEQYAEALFESLQEVKPEHHDKILDNFVKILADNQDLKLFDEIERVYKCIDLSNKGVKEVEITTARKIAESQELLSILNKVAGQKLEIRRKIDQDLVGGVIIRVDDLLIDGSVKKSLNQLKEQIAGKYE